jgi:hypothetical protein
MNAFAAVPWALALHRKFETKILRNKTARPRSQFLHSSWEYITRSQIHECRIRNKATQFNFWEYLFQILCTVWAAY